MAARALPEWWSHYFHAMHFHERSLSFRIYTLPFREHLLQPPWCHADQQDAWFCPNILEGMRSSTEDEDDGPGGRAHDTVAQLESKLPTHDVEELVVRSMNVSGWPALRRNDSGEISPGPLQSARALPRFL